MEKMKVVMTPFLAYGHTSMFFELAKRLSHSGLFQIYFLSTSICLEPIRNHQFDDDDYYTYSSDNTNIQLIDLEVVPQDDLPPHYHSTKNLPPHLFNSLLSLLDSSKPAFFNLVKDLKPHLLIFDMFQPWAGEIARHFNIHSVLVLASEGTRLLYPDRTATKVPDTIPTSMNVDVVNGVTVPQRVHQAVAYSSKMVLVKSSKVIEEDFNEVAVTLGPYVQRPQPFCQEKVMDWLREKEEGSVVFVSLGSQKFFNEEEMEEMSKGLELSGVNFLWVVRFSGENKTVDVDSFLERTKGRGLIVDWAPQVNILSHRSIGGFLTHCGWNSVLESMYYGVPIIGMPIEFDHPYASDLAVKLGVGVQVKRHDQKIQREDVINAVTRVLVDEEGKEIRKRALELSQRLKEVEDQEFNDALIKIINLIKIKRE